MLTITNERERGAWVAQSVKHLSGSGHDLVVQGLSPSLGSLLSREPASLSAPLPVHANSLSLSPFPLCLAKINKKSF